MPKIVEKDITIICDICGDKYKEADLSSDGECGHQIDDYTNWDGKIVYICRKCAKFIVKEKIRKPDWDHFY